MLGHFEPFLVNYAPTKTRGQNYNHLCSQNNPFHGYFLTPLSKLVHNWLGIFRVYFNNDLEMSILSRPMATVEEQDQSSSKHLLTSA